MAPKGKKMNLKQAADWLQTTDHPYGFEAIRKAVAKGKLKVQLMTNAPTPYYLVGEAELWAWAADPEMHKPGMKAKASKGSK